MRDYTNDYEAREMNALGRQPTCGDWVDHVGDGVRVGEKGVSEVLRATKHLIRSGGDSFAKAFGSLP